MAQQMSRAIEYAEKYLGKPARVLVVDDEPDILVSLEAFLRGCDTVRVSSGKAALVAIPEGRFDVVFLDLLMPIMDGVATLQEIKKITPSLPVVIMTGYLDNTLVNEALNLGAFSFLRKPYDFNSAYFTQLFTTLKLKLDPPPAAPSQAGT